MGLNAFIPCNCLAEGKTTSPPVDPQWIELDENGYYNLKAPHNQNQMLDYEVWQWTDHACKHSSMHHYQHICSWGNIRALRQACQQLGQEHFPTLLSNLPKMNKGCMSPEDAQKIKQELTFFQENKQTLGNHYLIDSQSKNQIYEYIKMYDGIFHYARPHLMGLNADGLFIMDVNSKEIIFQAKRAQQIVTKQNNWYRKLIHTFTPRHKAMVQQVEWKDVDSDKSVISRCHISLTEYTEAGPVLVYPEQLEVVYQNHPENDYDSIIKALHNVCQHAIKTGNHVYWS